MKNNSALHPISEKASADIPLVLRSCLGRGSGFGSFLLATALLTLASRVGGADTPFTATGYVYHVPVPGIWVTNPLGQVQLKGNVHLMGMQSSDPRMTGRRQAGLDLGWQTNGTAFGCGSAYFEIGTWQDQTHFTPAGGLWVMNYRGVVQSDNSDQMTVSAYGVGGVIDGLRAEATASREAGPMFDPAIPYLVSGMIKLGPLNQVMASDDFEDGRITGWIPWSSNNQGYLRETNGRLTVRGYWPGEHGTSWAKGWRSTPALSLADGQTIERRAELVSMGESTTVVNNALCGNSITRGYTLSFGPHCVCLSKWMPGFAPFSCDRANLPRSNVVLSLALTRVRTNLVVSGRVLDKADPERVLFERTVVDTPGVEPTLTAGDVNAVMGLAYTGWTKDVQGSPWFTFDYADLEIIQENDGTKPEALVVFDNFELRRYAVPQLSIEPAVRLTWPATGMNFGVEGAPTPQGPWLPVQGAVPPGFEQMYAPTDGLMRFFRLKEVP